jgi:outer membrane immunogenic protein
MKYSFLTSVSVGAILLGGAAQAADVARPAYKAPAAIPTFNWTGFYVGANIGVARNRANLSDDPSSPVPFLGAPADANKTGLIGGIQAGYNYQISQLLLGIEADIALGNGEASVSGFSFGTGTYTSRLSRLGTVRGRVGLAFDRFLVYGTGGGAFASIKNEFTEPAFPFTAHPKNNLTGWTAGGGFEYALTDHWTAKAEYLHVWLPSQTGFDSTGFGYVFAFKNSIDVARVGINYKF